ncbi:hypothetical protein VTL71DRAFT_11635 [Oculimacula yallundae]|uniref:Uncharacterized protein n=1 Tax=Oculimacula yallundae TaxID=86028 RepID=A0ABR4CQM4_9HELO
MRISTSIPLACHYVPPISSSRSFPPACFQTSNYTIIVHMPRAPNCRPFHAVAMLSRSSRYKSDPEANPLGRLV